MDVGYLDKVVAPEAADEALSAAITHMKSLNMGAFAGNKAIINRQLIDDIEASPLPNFG